MRAKVTSVFKGMDNTSTEPVDIKAGTELSDNPAWYAVQAGYAEWIDPPTEAQQDIMRHAPAPKFPLEQKAGTAPANALPKAEPGEGASGATSPQTADQDRMDRSNDSGKGKGKAA